MQIPQLSSLAQWLPWARHHSVQPAQSVAISTTTMHNGDMGNARANLDETSPVPPAVADTTGFSTAAAPHFFDKAVSRPISQTGLDGIALVQMDVTPGQPDRNFAKILAKIAAAKAQGHDVVVFPEMALPGYLIGDKWENDTFIRDLMDYNDKIREASYGITVIWGSVWAEFDKLGEDGRIRKYNSALIASHGEWVDNGVLKGRTYKSLLPQYREFDDARHFYSLLKLAHEQSTRAGAVFKRAWRWLKSAITRAPQPSELAEYMRPFAVTIRGQKRKIGIILCEDMWHQDYADNPTHMLIENGAEAIINISCSPWTWRKNDKRNRVVKELMDQHDIPFLYCNNTGAQNNGKNLFLFDGNSTVYGKGGAILAQANDYAEEILAVKIPAGEPTPLSNEALSDERDIAELYNGLIFGIRNFFSARTDKRVVIGLSGGIDSAVTATLLTMALGAGNVYAVNMPSQFNSLTTKNAARELATTLGLHYAIVGIQELTELTQGLIEGAEFSRLDGSGTKTPMKLSGVNLENVQARHRGATLLCGIASALGALYTNNGNKTETALGYATLYGDVNGAIAPLADLYKWQVFALANHMNKIHRETFLLDIIPQTIINVKPSAELSADQNVDEGKGDPMIFPYHDRVLRSFIEFRKDPEDILRRYADGTLEDFLKIPAAHRGIIAQSFPTPKAFIENLEWVWNSMHRNYFKRVQAPTIIAVSKRAFGFDLRESLGAPYYTQGYLSLKKWFVENEGNHLKPFSLGRQR